MALRLRRGTDIERLQIIPESGELIFVTDQELLYIGDGTTPGGILVSGGGNGLAELVNDNSPQLGGDLDLNTWNVTGSGSLGISGSPLDSLYASLVSADTLTSETQPEITLGSDLNLGSKNIVGIGDINIDGTITATGNIDFGGGPGSTLVVSELTSTTVTSETVSTDVLSSNSQSAILLDSNLDLNSNNIVGLGNINIDGTITATGNISLGDDPSDIVNIPGSVGSNILPQVDSFFDIGATGLAWQNGHFNNVMTKSLSVDNIVGSDSTELYNSQSGTLSVPNLLVDVVLSQDSTVIYDSSTGTLSAFTVQANTIEGDIRGSVFAADASIMVNTEDNAITATEITSDNLYVNSITSKDGQLLISDGVDGLTTVVFEKNGSNAILGAKVLSSNENFIELTTSNGTIAAGTPVVPGDGISGLLLNGLDTQLEISRSIAIAGFVDPNGIVADEHISGKLVFINRNSTGVEDVSGSADVVASFDSRGTFEAPVFQTGNYADVAERDAFVTSPVAGMIIFLADSDGSGTPQFQGYNGTTWVSFT